MLVIMSSIRINNNWNYQNMLIIHRMILLIFSLCLLKHCILSFTIIPRYFSSCTTSISPIFSTFSSAPLKYHWSTLADVGAHSISPCHEPGLEKVPISPWLVTLLHICGVIPTPQSPDVDITAHRYHVLLVVQMFYNVLHVFHDVLLCLTMFYDV